METAVNKILILDDDIGFLQAIKFYLEKSGFVVRTSSNINEAWEIISNYYPDLFIIDILVKDQNGYDFIKQLRINKYFSLVPIIVLTVCGMTQDRIQGYKSGCDSYLTKPFDSEELLILIRRLMVRHIQTLYLNQSSSINNNIYINDINFTPTEQKILNLIINGLMNKQIAVKLNVGVRNVEKYVTRLFKKTKTTSRTELVRFALENHLTM
uniref:Hypothetical two component transcriptional regulator Ycf29 n=1 Tax=Glaucocystis incrassata TaxID=1789788 RepID=A0A3G1IVE1_9EUKA|nr:hypothetical two component transcriptional regulator Ycf29 [Glaucocystis incrassata]ASQ40026.1 hypothetical two component transcriptional regulator Ycf29 [Glaucocystis incrassata]